MFDTVLSQVKASTDPQADQYVTDVREFRNWLLDERGEMSIFEADIIDVESHMIAMEKEGHDPSTIDRRQAALSTFYETAEQHVDSREESVENNPIYRPFGYVRDKPVIRQIDGSNLYLGNVAAADSSTHDREFEYILSLTEDEQPRTTHHRPLLDGPGNDLSTFERAVNTARRLYRDGNPLLIHCLVGISRSTTVVATTLAAENELSFREAMTTVRTARPIAKVNPALWDIATVYLENAE